MVVNELIKPNVETTDLFVFDYWLTIIVTTNSTGAIHKDLLFKSLEKNVMYYLYLIILKQW